MAKSVGSRAASDGLVAVGELLAALVEALTHGKPEEITALAQLLERQASSLVVRDPDPACITAVQVLRERAALLIETLFATTDRFLHDALDVQARERGYRPPARFRQHRLSSSDSEAFAERGSATQSRFPDLRA